MLVDARWQPPDPPPPPRPRRELPWTQIKWAALMMLFLTAAYVAPPLVAFFCVCAALYCFVECGRTLLPRVGGMRDYRQ